MATTATLSNILLDTTGAGASGIVVRVQLVASSGFLADASSEVITYFETASDDTGLWSSPVTPQDQLEDTGAYYQVTEGRKQWAVSIPTAGSYTLRPQIINVPASSGGGGGSVSGLLTGTIPPVNGQGNDGDAYIAFIDSTHVNIYRKVSGAWVGPTSLIGPAGGVSSVQGKTGVITTLSPTDLTPDALVFNDASVTNARTPTAHAASHGPGGTDQVTSTVVGAASITLRPINVKDQANPLANAIMDGGGHALSTRFANLGLAQAVFPRATALTEEIDWHAIQVAIDTGVNFVDLSVGTAVLHQALIIPAGGNITISGEQPPATVLFLRNGANTNVLQVADEANSNPNVCLNGFSVNGNSAGNTGTIGQTDGIRLFRCDNLRINNVEVHHVNGRGLHHNGVTGTTTVRQSWTNVNCHHNQHWGIWNSNGVRKVQYTDISCNNNGLRGDISLTNTGNAADSFTGGFLFDHSETGLQGIECHNNGQDGLWIRNVFACTVTNVRATQNGRHGVRVLGLVDSSGDDWVCQGNSQNNTLAGRDIWFDGTNTLNYGITARTRINNIEAGPDASAAIATQGSWTSPEDWAIYFDDGMSVSDLEVHAKVYAGTAGTVRFPTAGIGTMFYSDGPNAGLERVNTVASAGSTETLPDVNAATLHRLTLDSATCAITLPPPAAGKSFSVSLIQDGTGGRLATWLPGGSVIKWTGGTPPVLSTGAGQVDLFTFLCLDGVHYLGLVSGQDF